MKGRMANIYRPSSRTLIWSVVFSMVIVIAVGLWWRPGLFVTTPPATSMEIGVLLPAIPSLMDVALSMKNGMELAREDLPGKLRGAPRVKFDYANACFERETAPAVQRFIHEQVAFIGGSFCLFGHIPILPLIEASRILTFNTAANPDTVLNRPYAFSTNIEIKDEARRMAEFAYHILHARRAAFMHLDTPFGQDYRRYFTERFEVLGGKLLLARSEPPDAINFVATVQEIRAAGPDLIVTAHFGVPLGTFFKEVRQAGLAATLLGDYETEDPEVVRAAGDAASGVIYASTGPFEKTVAMRAFERSFIRKYGYQPDLIAANAYDDIMLGVDVFLQCHGTGECMDDKMHRIVGYQGASGVITMNESGATEKPTVFKMIKDGMFIPFTAGGKLP